jgi:hypothetical protein
MEAITMTLQEKSLYHQIHPLKLFTDWSTGIIALYPFWQHNILIALLIGVIPSILVSLVLISFVNLENYKQSSFGKYIYQYMTRLVEIIRSAGYILMAIGTWFHLVWLIPIGLLVILLAWVRGVFFPNKTLVQ